ncbi:MAG: hypothetical protein ACRD4U_01510 [Candidatus Acidiferrales bacterium]
MTSAATHTACPPSPEARGLPLDRIGLREQDGADLEALVRLTERILGDSAEESSQLLNLGVARVFLQQAREQFQKGEAETGELKLARAGEVLKETRAWLSLCDQKVTPLVLRGHLASASPSRPLLRALIRHFLRKEPRNHYDRDKLDHVVTEYLWGNADKVAPSGLRTKAEELFAGIEWKPLSSDAEGLARELDSLARQVESSAGTDKLLLHKTLERAHLLKSQLGEEFYHPHILPVVVSFNRTLRRYFLKHHYRQQLEGLCQETRQNLDDATQLVVKIQEAYKRLCSPQRLQLGYGAVAEEELGESFRLTVARLALFLRMLPAEQAQAPTVAFPSYSGPFTLASWERDAFLKFSLEKTPPSARTIQFALGLMVWMEDEMARYQRSLDDKGGPNPHFYPLSYGIRCALELLFDIRALLGEGAVNTETLWFLHLKDTADRLALTLRHVIPVFQDVPAVAAEAF